MRRVSDRGPSRFCLSQYLIDLIFVGCNVPQTKLCGASNSHTEARILCKLASRIKGKYETALHVKHHDCSRGMRIVSFELVTGYALRRQTEAVTVKRKRPLQIQPTHTPCIPPAVSYGKSTLSYWDSRVGRR